MITRIAPLLLLLLTLPAAAQAQHCVEVWEFWSYDTWHEVNLDTGQVTSYEGESPYGSYGVVDSSDGRYSAHLGWESGTFYLALTDFDRGVTVTLAENASSPAWSPESNRLAYTQSDTEQDIKYLVIYDVDTGAHLSTILPENEQRILHLAWSPDGSLIAAVGVVDQADGRSVVRLYAANDLTLVNTFNTTLTSAEVQWSPSGRYLAAFGTNSQVALIDVVAEQMNVLTLTEPSFYEFDWSSEESFVVIEHSPSDLSNEIFVSNIQGELVLQNILISSYTWANDHQLVVSVWTLSGLNDLTLFNLQTGQQQVLQHSSDLYAVSSDGRYLAVHVPYMIRIFDLSLERTSPIRILSINEPIGHFIWLDDQPELIFLFPNRLMRGYDFATSEWRSIATVPGDEFYIRNVPCSH
jgi:WD40 repeat protein